MQYKDLILPQPVRICVWHRIELISNLQLADAAANDLAPFPNWLGQIVLGGWDR